MAERGVHDLNRMILDEEAIIESYARMVSDAKDPALRERLKSIQENHFNRMMIFADRVLELNGEPSIDTGLRGIRGDIRHHDDTDKDITDLETARMALKLEGESAEKLATYDFNDIDTKAHKIHKEALDQETGNMDALDEYIRLKEIQ